MPGYRPDVPAWLDLGGIWVTANLRGGAEYGEAWHKAGMLEKKQNVFDDFIAVAEHLVARAISRRRRDSGSMGGSNGGLLVGAVMEQRPDLFAVGAAGRRRAGHAALRPVHRRQGLGDRVRVGVRTPQQFPFIFKYSPLHNLEPGTCYPGDAGDDRGSRRPRRAEPFVQVHRGAAGGAGLRPAGADPGRDRRLAQLPVHRQADRRARRRVDVRRGADG